MPEVALNDWLYAIARAFGYVESLLDSIDLLPGKSKFTVWTLLKGLVIITVFLLVATLVSRFIHRRVIRMEGLAPSTRIGSRYSCGRRDGP